MNQIFNSYLKYSLDPIEAHTSIDESSFDIGQTCLIECPHTLTSQESPLYLAKLSYCFSRGLVPILLPEGIAQSSNQYFSFGSYIWPWKSSFMKNPFFTFLSEDLKKEFIRTYENKDPALGLFTSGSTGQPKIIWHRISHYIHAAKRSQRLLKTNPKSQVLSALPCYHNGGFLNLVRKEIFPHQLELVSHHDLIPTWRDGDFDIVIGVPTQLALAIKEFTPSHQVLFYCGGASLNESLWEKAQQKKINVVATYGLTESCGAILFSQSPHLGFEPMEEVKVSIQPDHTLSFEGPSNAFAYQSGNTIQFVTGAWSTQDLAEFNDKGNIILKGRKDQTIICSGENIDPAEIVKSVQSFLKKHNFSNPFSVIPIDDPIKGQIPILAIDQLHLWTNGERELLIDYLRQHLSPLKKPRFLMSYLTPVQGIKVTQKQWNDAFTEGKVMKWKI